MTINYKTTVNLSNRTLYLQLSGILPEAAWDKHIRVQAVFSQRLLRRIFPMQTEITEEDMDRLFNATAKVRLPYVFRNPPKHDVTLTWSLWIGTEEILLEDQPFPVNKEQFSLKDYGRKKSRLRYGIYTALLPAMLLRNYFASGKNMEAAKKKTNATVYRGSGYSYSPRQRNTDYFASKYRAEVLRNPKPKANRVLFLSERLPEKGGNLLRLMEVFRKEPGIETDEFILTRTVDQLRKRELSECAEKCAQAKVIILEDFYPQLHSIYKRPETKIVQLWHACGAFKTFGYTRLGKRGGAPQSSMNHRNYDLVPVSSPKLIDIYAEAFALNPDSVKALGVPRTDVFFDENYKESKRRELYARYPMLEGRRVVLFAPTFRGDGNKDAYYPPEAFDAEAFLSKLPEDIVLIVKHHPFVKSPLEAVTREDPDSEAEKKPSAEERPAEEERPDVEERPEEERPDEKERQDEKDRPAEEERPAEEDKPDVEERPGEVHNTVELQAPETEKIPKAERLPDLTGEDLINDLLLVSDLLITDYSSCIFEAALLKVPMLFYAFDEEEYSRNRGFYFGYRDFVPGEVVSDQEELVRAAGDILSGSAGYDTSVFEDDFLSAIDGSSTERIAEYIKTNYLR